MQRQIPLHTAIHGHTPPNSVDNGGMVCPLPPFAAAAWQLDFSHLSALAESPFWCERNHALVWADIARCEVLACQPGAAEPRRWQMPSSPGCVAPSSEGGYVLALRDGVYTATEWGGPLTKRWRFEPQAANLRLNDGKADAFGRFWVGSYSEKREATAELFCLEPLAGAHAGDWQVAHHETGFAASNGLGFGQAFGEGFMTWANTAAHQLELRQLNAAGMPLPNPICVDFTPKPAGWTWDADPQHNHYAGRPDGACVDSAGYFWVALFEGSAVIRVSPSGQVLQRIQTPCLRPTMPCLGGPDFKTLFITSAQASTGSAEALAQPLGGSVWALRLDGSADVAGVPVHRVKTHQN